MPASLVQISSHSSWSGLQRKVLIKGLEREQILYQRARLAGLLAVKNLPSKVDLLAGTAWITIAPAKSKFGQCLLALGIVGYSETDELGFVIEEFGNNLHRKSVYAESFIHHLYREGLRSTHVEFNYRWND